MKDILIAVARLLDARKWIEAHRTLKSIPLGRFDQSQRLVARALWMRFFTNYEYIEPSFDQERLKAIKAFKIISASEIGYETRRACLYNVEAAIKVLPASDVAAIISCLFWDIFLASEPDIFIVVFRLIFNLERRLSQHAWTQYITAHRYYVPAYWEFFSFITSLELDNTADITRAIYQSLDASQRLDLARLFDAYLVIARQAPVEEVAAAARALIEPDHRLLLADHLIQAKVSAETIEGMTELYFELAGDLDPHYPGLNLLLMRRSAAGRRWEDVLERAKYAASNPQYRLPVKLLQAHALARLHETRGAQILLDDAAADPAAVEYNYGLICDLRLAAHRARRGFPALDEQPPKEFPRLPGKPLAQSLWIGPRLRWIEQLSIKSYLDNGWRFQLYVYDEPDNVPSGCEILDASVIIPAEDVFREGAESGFHAGSVGAFSDLFRYKLLYDRGGMWTDTDVINFENFDPDGCRFISTDCQDAGIVSLNGALMAAPARDPFMKLAYEKALEALALRESFFFTRIGPCLLAEIALCPEAEGVELMRPDFLGPISWLNAGLLLQPYERVTGRSEFQAITNLHVYTETWRLCGLGLDQPPPPGTYIGKIYEKHFAPSSLRVEDTFA